MLLALVFGFPEATIGAIVAALIAGLVSLLGLIISKEQKISEFRQAWIDALRTEISALISHANAIQSANAAGFKNGTEAWKSVREDFLGINQATAKIRLRLNPNEAKSLLILLEEMEKLLAPGRAIVVSSIDDTEKKLVAEAQILLKGEWLRVRRGERTYQVAKYAALGLLIASIVAIVAFAVRS